MIAYGELELARLRSIVLNTTSVAHLLKFHGAPLRNFKISTQFEREIEILLCVKFGSAKQGALCNKTLRDTGASYLKTRREQAIQRAASRLLA